MNKISDTTTQARRRSDPADQIIGDARKPYMLHALQVMIRRRNKNRFGFLSDDDEDRPLAIALYSLGSRKTKWDGVMPWLKLMPKLEREAFEQRAAQFKPTLRNIAVAARLTRGDRDKYGREERRVGYKTKRPMQALLQLPIIDGDLEAERRDARNAARRKRRQEARAKAADPRVQRRRQRDREYQQGKRRSEGVMPRSEYLAASVEAAKPDGISRMTWWRRRKAGGEIQPVIQVRRQKPVIQVRRQSPTPKPLN